MHSQNVFLIKNVLNYLITLLHLGAILLLSHSISISVGSQVLASGTVQVSRFTLLQSGGLQIKPVSFQDSGEYTCIAANSEGTINATATLTVWSKTHALTYYTHKQKCIKLVNVHSLNGLKQIWYTNLSIAVQLH